MKILFLPISPINFLYFNWSWMNHFVPLCRNRKILGQILGTHSKMITWIQIQLTIVNDDLFRVQKSTFGTMCALQIIAEHVLTFFKRKWRFLHSCVLFKAKVNTCSPFSNVKEVFCTDVCFSKQNWTRAHLFQTKKTFFVQMCDFQSKAEDVLTVLRPKRHFLYSWVLF